MTNITNPPWRWVTNGALVQDSGDRLIVLMAGRCQVTGESEMKVRGPNNGPPITMNPYGSVAKLIEAAPRLLAALKGLEELMTGDGYQPSHYGGDKLVAARDLINKIEGNPPQPSCESDF